MLSPNYQTKLRENYPEHQDMVDTLIYGWQYAALPDQEGEALPYVRLNEGSGAKPVLYVPGFTEGIAAKAPFAAELAAHGQDVILPDQNRKSILEDAATSKKSASYSQAVNYLAVLEAEVVSEADVITHSYGSLIFEAMARLAKARGTDYFKGAKVIMLAPAGFSKESFLRLGGRFFKEMAAEGKKSPKEFDEPDMLKAGVKNFVANIPRAFREGGELKRNNVDVPRLLGNIGSLSLVSYADDRLYGDRHISKRASRAVQAGATWEVPILQKQRFDPASAKPPATHNDEQFNPYRAAASVLQILGAS